MCKRKGWTQEEIHKHNTGKGMNLMIPCPFSWSTHLY